MHYKNIQYIRYLIIKCLFELVSCIFLYLKKKKTFYFIFSSLVNFTDILFMSRYFLEHRYLLYKNTITTRSLLLLFLLEFGWMFLETVAWHLHFYVQLSAHKKHYYRNHNILYNWNLNLFIADVFKLNPCWSEDMYTMFIRFFMSCSSHVWARFHWQIT